MKRITDLKWFEKRRQRGDSTEVGADGKGETGLVASDEIGEIHRLKYSVKTRKSEGRGRGGMEAVEGRKGVCGVGWG